MKKLIIKIWNAVKGVFIKKPTPQVLKYEDITELDMDNFPINSNNIKKGELGGYIIYNKNTAKITDEFIKNLKELGIDILYFNTPRDKDNPSTFLSYQDWLDIFDKFKDSGIRIMLYIYEALTKKDRSGKSIYPKWTDVQIKSISNHPSFYGWIAEDEVSAANIDSSQAWIKTFHNQKFSDGTKKWPNMSICMYPKTERLEKLGTITNPYSNYLEMWAPHADIILSDMYPIRADQDNNAHYNIEEDGKDSYNPTTGGSNWIEYLKAHREFIESYPNLKHMLYMHTCKDVTADGSGKPFIAKPKPTLLNLKIQAYANLMSGSDGLMLFVLGDIGTRFSEAAFSRDLTINKDTYNLMKSFFMSAEFKNFKNLITNLRILKLAEVDKNILEVWAESNEYQYTIYLNLSLTETVSVPIYPKEKAMNLAASTYTTFTQKRDLTIKPGDILCIKNKIK